MAEPVRIPEEKLTDVRSALTRLCEQPQFANSPALIEMLSYVVNTTLRGSAESLKAYTIATQALGRPVSFDPQADPIVRVTATRLRRALEAYAQGPGKADPVTIILERGSYVPRFVWRDQVPAVLPVTAVPAPVIWPPRFTPGPTGGVLGLAVVAMALAVYVFFPNVAWRATGPSTGAVVTPGEPFVLGATPPVPETRPTLIVGKLTFNNADPVLEAVGRQLRAKFISELRPFDDILNIRDEPDHTREPNAPSTPPMTYLIEGDIGVRADRVIMTTAIKSLATGIAIYSSVYDEPRESDPDLSRVAALLEGYAIHIAQPYGIISSNVWRTLRNTPAQQGTYICQLRVFNYWQVYKREAFEHSLDCVLKRLAAEPDSAPVLSSLTFLYVEAVRAGYQLPDPELASRPQILDRVLRIANKSVQAEPDSARTHSAMAAAYMINRNIPAAIDAARQALKLNPRDPELKADLGAKLVQAGSYKEAIALLNAVIAGGGAQPPWRNIFAALANYMLDEKEGLTRQAGVLRKEEGLLVTVIQLLDAIATKNEAGVLTAKAALAAIAPKGHSQIMSALGDRIYNVDVLNRISKDIAPLLSN